PCALECIGHHHNPVVQIRDSPTLPPYWQKNGTHLAALPLHSGNALPLFWHCRLTAAYGPRNHWLLQHGTPIALSVATESGQPAKVSRNEHQLR
ncbi:hypothetical protein, partial [Pseudomonas syringae]|uniref:hypothetical protein n=1 Tax=Pseudomonas syringae TaxID=317 RepID=UPI0019D6E580